MILDVLDAPFHVAIALGEVSLEEVLDEGLGVFVEAPRKLHLALQDLLVDEHWVLVRERVDSSDHFVEKNAESPPVDWLAVTFVEKHLWGKVLWRSAQGVSTGLNDLSKAKIGQLKIASVVDQNVLGFEVPVNSVLAVEVLKHANDLGRVELRLLWLELAHAS